MSSAKGWTEITFQPHALVYAIGRDPRMRMSTNLFALRAQSGPDATFETPIRARSRLSGSRSARMSPLSIARFTKPLIDGSSSMSGPQNV
jgi:hypothetical protein